MGQDGSGKGYGGGRVSPGKVFAEPLGLLKQTIQKQTLTAMITDSESEFQLTSNQNRPRRGLRLWPVIGPQAIFDVLHERPGEQVTISDGLELKILQRKNFAEARLRLSALRKPYRSTCTQSVLLYRVFHLYIHCLLFSCLLSHKQTHSLPDELSN